MWQELLPGLRLKIFLTVLLGIVYPLVVTAISQAAFSYRANGSLVAANGQAVGSELIAQNFTQPYYFHPRPSAAGRDGYDATASAGTNYGPTNQKLIERTRASVDKFRKENPEYKGPIPADLLTASASGLDPHISPAAAEAQAMRVANSRRMSTDNVRQLIARFTDPRTLGVIGEPRVNVLLLNLELDRQFPRK